MPQTTGAKFEQMNGARPGATASMSPEVESYVYETPFSVSVHTVVPVVPRIWAAAIVKWPVVLVGVPVTLTEPRTVLPAAATISKPIAKAAPPLETRSWLSPRMPTRASTLPAVGLRERGELEGDERGDVVARVDGVRVGRVCRA